MEVVMSVRIGIDKRLQDARARLVFEDSYFKTVRDEVIQDCRHGEHLVLTGPTLDAEFGGPVRCCSNCGLVERFPYEQLIDVKFVLKY
jgi:hypothetical protein